MWLKFRSVCRVHCLPKRSSLQTLSAERHDSHIPQAAHNTFGIAAKAERLLRLRSMQDVEELLTDPIRLEPHFVLGGGSNIVITGDIVGHGYSQELTDPYSESKFETLKQVHKNFSYLIS